ncbi:unnamed protein product, partial [Bubo scandiacus]
MAMGSSGGWGQCIRVAFCPSLLLTCFPPLLFTSKLFSSTLVPQGCYCYSMGPPESTVTIQGIPASAQSVSFQDFTVPPNLQGQSTLRAS